MGPGTPLVGHDEDPVAVVSDLRIPAVLVDPDGEVIAVSAGARVLGVDRGLPVHRVLQLLAAPGCSLVARAISDRTLLVAAYPAEEEGWLSHDLRNALAIVSGAAFVLRRGHATQREAALALIEEQVTRIEALL